MLYTTIVKTSQPRTLALSAGALLICLASAAGPCTASSIVTTLGSAGPGNWAILVGPNTTDFALNGPGTTIGNVGYDGTHMAQLNASDGHQAINGNLFLSAGASVNDATQVSGTIVSPFAILGADWTTALNASAVFAAMAANFSVPGGKVNGTMTINSQCAGCTNVIDLTSLRLGNGQVLTLNGGASDQFIINISDEFTLNSGRILLTGGLTAADVVFNVTSSGNAVSASGGLNNESIVTGILLAPNSGIAFAPGLINGELIAGGSTVHLVSGASTTEAVVISAVPELSTYLLLGSGLLVLGCRGLKSKATASRR
jgi:choice-of-anchor A domain-containing protein